MKFFGQTKYRFFIQKCGHICVYDTSFVEEHISAYFDPTECHKCTSLYAHCEIPRRRD